MPRRELKQRVSESRAKRVWTLPSVSCFNRRLNNANTAKKNGYFLGHSDNLITLSLSLSQALAYNYKRGNNTFYFTRGHPR